MKDYVKEYFDRHAGAWVEQAYVEGQVPEKFPVGPERVRLALQGVAPAIPRDGSLVDLGCGGGQLLLHAAQLGWSAVGVDVAPGMVEEARRLCADLPVTVIERAYDENGLDAGSAHAVTALGLIEYLPEDAPLFAEARRLLRPGGRFALSCRNRLFNLQSANAYTEAAIRDGDAAGLLDELEDAVAGAGQLELHRLARELARAASDLERAVDKDDERDRLELLDHPSMFREERRQHTPRELERSARGAGFSPVAVYPLHPHPLPPATEQLAPHVFNRLALAWQRAFDGSLLGLAFCTAFVAVYEC